MQDVEAWLSSETAYETASETYERITGVKLSEHHMHEATNAIGQEVGILEACPSKEDIYKKLEYLANHGKKMNYDSAKRGGYHIGSGAIESANKFISHTRLKRSGAWWYIKYANNILKIRCAKYNGTYDKIVEKYKREDQERIKNKKFEKILRVVK